VITWLRSASGEQRKLLLSVGTNFLTRIPGAIGLLWFLPLLRFGLGTDDYANLLASMALASAAAFQSGGFNLIGRRLIGEAYSNGDKVGEANALASAVIANAVAASLTVAIIATYCWVRSTGIDFLIVSSLSATGFFLVMFDSARSAYNEHYVTAMLLIVLQSAAYVVGFLMPMTRHNILLGGLVLMTPYWLTSLITFVLLLRDRPHLLYGRPVAIWLVIRQGTMLAMADGFLMATLSLSVVWLQTSASAETSAWFATNVRLFQTLLVPVSLLLVPLSSYIRILWNSKSVAQQQAYTKATLLIGLTYGAIVAVLLFVASQLYVGWLLQLPVPRDLSIFLLFGAIVAYKSYSSVAYVVLDESAHLSSWTTAAVSAAVALGAVASLAVDPLNAINVYALAAGLLMIVVLFWNTRRSNRPSATHVRL
jgi:hypothetical protein